MHNATATATAYAPARNPSALQAWVGNCSVLQQSVLMSAIRGLDGLAKLHPAKMLVRFYRRSILISALDMASIDNGYDQRGGDFTGPSITLQSGGKIVWGDDAPDEYFHTSKGLVGVDRWWTAMEDVANNFLRSRDEMPLHYFTHAMHAFHIVAVFHPLPDHRKFWRAVYERMVDALHLSPEPDAAMCLRLSDDPDAWRARMDVAGSCQT